MAKNLSWKIALIVAVLAVAGYFTYPPKDRINLGLDLQGGSHIVMQVETTSAVKYEMDLTQSRIGQALKEKGLAYGSVSSPEPSVLEVQGTDPSRRADVRKVLDDYVGQWDIKDLGSGSWRLIMPLVARTAIEKNAVETTLTTLRSRIDELGVREPIVQKQGVKGDRILVQLPGIEDPARAKEVMQDPALLEWKAVTYPPGITDFAAWEPPESPEAARGPLRRAAPGRHGALSPADAAPATAGRRRSTGRSRRSRRSSGTTSHRRAGGSTSSATPPWTSR